MGTALLNDLYNELPPYRQDETRQAKADRLRALSEFKRKVGDRYGEGTLQRLLDSSSARTRRAAVLALGMLGSMRSNALVAGMLHDEDREVRQLAANALWSLWFRADTEEHNEQLQSILRMGDAEQALARLSTLIQKAPSFAEAYNQRAILYFRMGEYQRSVADCEAVLKLNPYHFGAQSGMAQCYLKLKKPQAALKAFRAAFRINPGLEGVEETIRALEDALGEEGKK